MKCYVHFCCIMCDARALRIPFFSLWTIGKSFLNFWKSLALSSWNVCVLSCVTPFLHLIKVFTAGLNDSIFTQDSSGHFWVDCKRMNIFRPTNYPHAYMYVARPLKIISGQCIKVKMVKIVLWLWSERTHQNMNVICLTVVKSSRKGFKVPFINQ